MATFTDFLNLRKPATSDNVNVTLDLSDNFEAIDTAIETLDARVDASEDASKHLATGFSAGPDVSGDNLIATTNSFLSNGLRMTRITCRAEGRCNISNLTGHSFIIQRELNTSGSWVSLPDTYWVIWPRSDINAAMFFEIKDTPPAGNVRYRVRAQGHGINGNHLVNTRIEVWDAGLG